MVNLNTLLLVVFVEILLELFRFNQSLSFIPWIVVPGIFGIFFLVVGYKLQKWHIDRRTEKWVDEANEYIERVKVVIDEK